VKRWFLALAAVAVVACTSPESTRTRGGSPGADKGNRGDVVLMHEGSKPYANTPQLISATPPALDSAQHAHRLSTDAQ
jgi:hypothetical protein